MRVAPILSLVALGALLVVPSASAGNGSFEKCKLTGWSSSARGGDSYWKVYSDKNRKLRDFGGATLPRPFGRCAAAFVQDGPSDGALVRKIRVARGTLSLSLRYFFINQAAPPRGGGLYPRSVRSRGGAMGPWYDYGVFSNDVMGSNQFFSIDLIRKSAGGRAVREKDILAHCYSPTPGATPARSMGWRVCSLPLHRFQGKTVKLRVAAVDNSFFLNVGIDRLQFATTPSFTG